MALLIMAVSAVPELVTIERALAVEGLTLEALDPAQDARVVVTTESGLEFRHPLIRAAAHARATAAERRAAHRALAAALADGPRVDDWAWHRALAVSGPDEGAAAALEAVGDRAKAASWHAAELAFERSARLTPFGEEARGRRLLAAAQAAQMGGRLDAGAALAQEAAAALEGDPALRAETTHLWGRIEAGRGAFRRAARSSRTAQRWPPPRAPERAALMLSDAVIPWAQLGEHGRADSAAQRSWELPWPRGGPTELSVTLMFADALCLRGRFSEALELWRRAADVPVEGDADALARIAEALFSAGDDEPARMAAERDRAGP